MDLGISTNPTPELYTIKVTGEIDISNADSLAQCHRPGARAAH